MLVPHKDSRMTLGPMKATTKPFIVDSETKLGVDVKGPILGHLSVNSPLVGFYQGMRDQVHSESIVAASKVLNSILSDDSDVKGTLTSDNKFDLRKHFTHLTMPITRNLIDLRWGLLLVKFFDDYLANKPACQGEHMQEVMKKTFLLHDVNNEGSLPYEVMRHREKIVAVLNKHLGSAGSGVAVTRNKIGHRNNAV